MAVVGGVLGSHGAGGGGGGKGWGGGVLIERCMVAKESLMHPSLVPCVPGIS